MILAPWYSWLEQKLEPSWPAMVAASVLIILITVYLLYRRQPVPMAIWLVYLLMP